MSSASTRTPSLIVLAGPNGAGKTTAAPRLLRDTLAVVEFVNADTIARGLAGFDPDVAALEAGAVMFDRIRQLGANTTALPSKRRWQAGPCARISDLMATGYEFHLVFLWLPSADFAVQRVADRVRLGGHGVPDATVRRRYDRGLRNFFDLYQPMATAWRMCDNTDVDNPRLIAEGRGAEVTTVSDRLLWERTRESIIVATNEPKDIAQIFREGRLIDAALDAAAPTPCNCTRKRACRWSFGVTARRCGSRPKKRNRRWRRRPRAVASHRTTCPRQAWAWHQRVPPNAD